MSERISKEVRQMVALRSGYRCEYCMVKEDDTFLSFHIDHIISQKHGGNSDMENLAFACPHCNQHKGTDIATFVGSDSFLIRLFNPRIEEWSDHFEPNYGEIIPKTEIASATVKLLCMNEPERVITRRILEELNCWP